MPISLSEAPTPENIHAVLAWLRQDGVSFLKAMYYARWDKQLLALKAQAEQSTAVALAGV